VACSKWGRCRPVCLVSRAGRAVAGRGRSGWQGRSGPVPAPNTGRPPPVAGGGRPVGGWRGGDQLGSKETWTWFMWFWVSLPRSSIFFQEPRVRV